MSTDLLSVRVARKTLETETICRLELVADGEQPLPAFTAGAHIDVHTPGGLVRQYSLSNHPADAGRYVIGVLRESASRGGSVAMHDAVAEGDRLQISAPRNHFELAQTAQQHLLFAGGIGVTPILSMAQQLGRSGQDFQLHYCTRSRAHAAFLDVLAAPELAPHVAHYFADAGPALDPVAAFGPVREGVHIYTCGPRGFMDWVLDSARQAGWPESQLHWEFFAGEAVDLSDADSFAVKIASTGRVIPVTKEQTVT
ncbi:MAG: ferredoxin reductase, partial [Comamonas sp.]